MDLRLRRSRGVTATTLDAPAATALDFEALYREARDDVYAYAATLLRDAAAAEDVTALAFERAYRWRSRFDALDELRRRKRAAAAEIPAPAAEPDPEEAAELAVQRDAVRRALGRLP